MLPSPVLSTIRDKYSVLESKPVTALALMEVPLVLLALIVDQAAIEARV